MKFKLNQLALASALTFISASVSAAGFQIFQQNASGLGNAYAGSAAQVDNASIIFFNPAGMTELKGRNISTGINIVDPSIKFTNNGSSTTAFSGASAGGDAGQTGVIPNLFYSHQIDKDLFMGLGISAPFGSHSKYSDGWIGSAQSIEFRIRTMNINPSVAWKIDDKFSIGGGLNIQKFEAKYIKASGTTPVALSNGRTTLDADDTSYGWNVGMLIKPDQKNTVGISYRSAVKHNLQGSVSTTGSLVPQVTVAGNGSASASASIPDFLILSWVHKLNPKIDLLADISRTGWSSIDKIEILNNSIGGAEIQQLDTKFKNSWRYALGLNYQQNSALKLKSGIAYDRTVVRSPDSRLVSLPDNDRYWLSVGAEYRLSKNSTLDLGIARVFIKDADISNLQNDPAANPNNVVGSYKSSAWLMGVQYSHSF